MTSIAFHFNVPDKLAYGCRLLRKAHAAGAKVVVTGEAAQLAELDQLLWTFSPLEFLPHRLVARHGAQDAPSLLATPLLLAESPADCPHQGVLVNLGTSVPDDFARFERFIELVTGDDGDKAAARQRWKQYAAMGYTIQKHDLAAAGEAA
ncbi:MAG: DNA polymerase III subunit chi [Comamonadaceae bacterium]|nr:MAG: DNA polymerase III subunit chi [Comamonadaceae bacterium]